MTTQGPLPVPGINKAAAGARRVMFGHQVGRSIYLPSKQQGKGEGCCYKCLSAATQHRQGEEKKSYFRPGASFPRARDTMS